MVDFSCYPEDSTEQYCYSMVTFCIELRRNWVRLEDLLKYLAWEVTPGQKKLRICQILERGCCNQSLRRGGRASRSGERKRLLHSRGLFPGYLGKTVVAWEMQYC